MSKRPIKSSSHPSNNHRAAPLIQQLLTSLHHQKDKLQGRRVWLACSGGRDSLSLALICRQLFDAGKLPFLPQLLHVNHGLQVANDTWAKQVYESAQTHNMPCYVLNADVKGSNEQSARNARYHAMMQVMNHEDVLMLAHHSDDQAETVLMRLFNGAGVGGLGGMKEWASKQMPPLKGAQNQRSKTVHLWRPWLTISRAQITDYAKCVGLNYVDDPTNLLPSHVLSSNELASKSHVQAKGIQADSQLMPDAIAITKANDRAWLRSVLLPKIKQRYPQAMSAIARSSELLQQANHIITAQALADINHCQLANQQVQGLRIKNEHKFQSLLAIPKLLTLSHARQTAAIHQWLAPNANDLPPTKQLVDEVVALCMRKNTNHQTEIYHSSHACGYKIYRYQHTLYRMRDDWAAWLSVAPLKQTVALSDNSEPSSNLLLKPKGLIAKTQNSHTQIIDEGSGFGWYLIHIESLAKALNEALHQQQNDLQKNNQQKKHQQKISGYLYFEPLPYDIKLTLAGRVGRKAGKKLMQALHIPALMRQSVILVSLKTNATSTALFVLSIQGVQVLQSAYTQLIKQWLNSYDYVSYIDDDRNWEYK